MIATLITAGLFITLQVGFLVNIRRELRRPVIIKRQTPDTLYTHTY